MVFPEYGGKRCASSLLTQKECNAHDCTGIGEKCHTKHVKCDFDFVDNHLVVRHGEKYNADGKFHCRAEGGRWCTNGLFGGAPKNDHCHFPFVFEGKTYNSCIGTEYGGYGLCSTTAQYSGSWGGCQPCSMCECRCTAHPGCCSKQGFVLENVEIIGNIYKNVPTKEECCWKCTNHPTCGSWEYNSNEVCILKQGAPVYSRDQHFGDEGQSNYEVWSGPRASTKDSEMCFDEYEGREVSHAHWARVARGEHSQEQVSYVGAAP